MKRSIRVMLACVLILTLGLAAWAGKPAQPTAYTTTKVTGGGWYIDNVTSNHCSLGFQARGTAVGDPPVTQSWSGQVTFTDRDYATGLLKVKVTVSQATTWTSYHLVLIGTATISIGGESQADTYDVEVWLYDAAADVPWGADGVEVFISTLDGDYHSYSDLDGGQVKFH